MFRGRDLPRTPTGSGSLVKAGFPGLGKERTEEPEQMGAKNGGYTSMVFKWVWSILEEVAKKERSQQRAGADLRSQ